MNQKKEFRLKSCPKGYDLDQDKSVEPSVTVRNALERLSKRFDLSNVRLEPRADVVRGAYSYSSLSDQLHACGKGLTLEQSKASAIMEFSERYSWLHFDYEKYDGYTVKTFNEIKKGSTPTVDESYFLCNFFGLKNRAELLDDIKNIPLKWIKGLSLIDQKEFYYPINWHNYIWTSNGLAAGNAVEEAICQALCEAIERENVYRLLHDKKAGNDLDQSSIRNPLIVRVLQNAKKAGITFVIKEISFDFGIPTFVVRGTCALAKGKLTYQGCGYGTHPSPEKAVMRGLAEYFETMAMLRKIENEVDLEWKRILSRMPRKNYGFLVLYNTVMFEEKKKIVKLSDIPDLSRDDIKDEIEHILKMLKKYKYNVIFIDKTHPELKIPVPRIFIPGFRSLTNTEAQDAWFPMAEAHFEAGNVDAAEQLLRQSLIRSSFHIPPDLRKDITAKKVFRKDYRENLIAHGDFKKDALGVLKSFEPLLNKYKAYW